MATTSTLFAADPPTPVPSGTTLPATKTDSDSTLAINFPDKFAWTLFVQINQKAKQQVPVAGGKTTNNAVWETWADDPWTFPKNPDPANPPKWPEGAEPGKRLIKGAASGVHRTKLPDQGVDASGSGGEEVHRNKATFDYIIKHNLWYQEGIAAIFAEAAKAKNPVGQTRAAVNFPSRRSRSSCL